MDGSPMIVGRLVVTPLTLWLLTAWVRVLLRAKDFSWGCPSVDILCNPGNSKTCVAANLKRKIIILITECLESKVKVVM